MKRKEVIKKRRRENKKDRKEKKGEERGLIKEIEVQQRKRKRG